jgi:hypothetical protein
MGRSGRACVRDNRADCWNFVGTHPPLRPLPSPSGYVYICTTNTVTRGTQLM